MRLYEYEAADVFESAGIPVPRRDIAATPEEALAVAETIGLPVILKAQVLVGGRGLAGGIKTAADTMEVLDLSRELLAAEIKGIPVRTLLIAKKVEIVEELYVGITVDGFSGKPVVIVSTRGGVSIEEAARRFPESVVRFPVDIRKGFFPYQARLLLKKLGLSHRHMFSLADVAVRLYRVFEQMDAIIAEINPLAVLDDGSLMAVDAVLEVDDSALFTPRFNRGGGNRVSADPGRIENRLERLGKEIGVTYVELDGDIGIIASGAGLGMATMDIIGQRLRPANFLETGGGITEELLYRSMELVMKKPGLRALFVNVYGGINPIHEGARGIVRYIREHSVTIPVVAKALGNRQEETWEILRSGGVHVVTDVPTEKAVERLFELVE